MGVIALNPARQRRLAVALGHGPHQLVVDQPGRAIAGAELAHECKGRQPRLGLADQEDRQKPGAQRQLRAVEQAARRQRGLVPAAAALEQLARPVANDVVRFARAARAAKAVGPTQRDQRRRALFFRAIALEEIRQGHAALELDSVHGHGWLSKVDASQHRQPQAHWMSQAEVHD